MARQRGSRPRGEQPEPVVEPTTDLLGRERAQPGGGQLDRQGLPVEAPADLGDGGPEAAVTVNPGTTAAPRSANRRTASSSARASTGCSTSPGTASGSRLVARILQAREAFQQRLHEVRGGVDEVLAVVEHEQELAVRRAR